AERCPHRAVLRRRVSLGAGCRQPAENGLYQRLVDGWRVSRLVAAGVADRGRLNDIAGARPMVRTMSVLLVLFLTGCAADLPRGSDVMVLHWSATRAITEQQAAGNNDMRIAL